MRVKSKYKYPYVDAGLPKIKTFFLKRIKEPAIPSKSIDQTWITDHPDFKAVHDSLFFNIITFLKFVDESGRPTDLWKQYRTNPTSAMRKSVINSYKEIFETAPDACTRKPDDLEGLFSATGASKAVAKKMAKTFLALCKLASINSTEDVTSMIESNAEAKENHTKVEDELVAKMNERSSVPADSSINMSPSIHIDLQIHISPDMTDEQIDRIFQSIAKHIIK